MSALENQGSVDRDVVRLDFNRSRVERVGKGQGLSLEDVQSIIPRVTMVLNDLAARRSRGEIGFLDLPYQSQGSMAALEQVVGRIRSKMDTLVLLGIGGSSLGGQTLIEALAPPFQELLPRERRQGPRVLFCDNVDPDRFGSLLDLLDLQRTAFAVVTKSGGTAETMAQFWHLRHVLIRALGMEGYRQRVVAITDPQQGRLRQVGRADGLDLLDIPPAVGGRYSALSPVGLFPAAVAGISAVGLLEGAKSMDQRCREMDPWKNPAALFAAMAFLMDTMLHRPILVLWPYADGLRRFGNWFVQLWAESLGKKINLEGRTVFAGATPMPAVGVTDQHAQNQLFMEGPADKFIVFFHLQRFQRELVLPDLSQFSDCEDVAYLGNKRMSQLMEAEYLSTAIALADAGRPSCTVDVPELNANCLGELIQLFEMACAIAGGLYRVNPFDQPGVEAGKKLTYALMGRPGFEALAASVANEDKGEARYRL